MFVYIGSITSTYNEPKPPNYERPAPVPREGNMGEQHDGINVFELDEATGAFRHYQGVSGLRNPSYLALHPTLPVMYTSERETTRWGPDETIAGGIVSLSVAPDGKLTKLNREPAAGGATYVSVHPAGTFLFGAMPGSGSVSAFRIEADGRVGPCTSIRQEQGRGVNTITLERPYPHSVRPDAIGRRVMSCDMGLDRITVYDLDQNSGRMVPAEHPYAQLSSGTGPRHLWIHPSNRFVFTANETETTVSAFSYDVETSAMRIVNCVSTRPEGFRGHTSCAQIVVHPSGKFLYCSTRGANNINTFSIDEDSGFIRLIGTDDSQGEIPRNFNLDPSGRFMVVANATSGDIVSFRIDPATGKLTPTGQKTEVRTPVCVLFGRN